MERKVENQVAAPAETRTPNLHRAKETLLESADGRVAAVVVARKKALGNRVGSNKNLVHDGSPSLLAEVWPSGPRRQGFAAPHRTRPRPLRAALQTAPLGGKLDFRKGNSKNINLAKVLLDIDRHSHGRRLHSEPRGFKRFLALRSAIEASTACVSTMQKTAVSP